MVLHAHPAGEDLANGQAAALDLPEPPLDSPVGPRRSPFPPIADYAFLSDCENTCLVSAAGSVE